MRPAGSNSTAPRPRMTAQYRRPSAGTRLAPRARRTGAHRRHRVGEDGSGAKRPVLPGAVWSRSGSRKVNPTKAAMAPAVCRMIMPSPSPSRPSRARNAPDERDGAQHAGLAEGGRGRAAGRQDGLPDEEAGEASAPRPRPARRSRRRRPCPSGARDAAGMAASDERMVPGAVLAGDGQHPEDADGQGAEGETGQGLVGRVEALVPAAGMVAVRRSWPGR